jgi:hypothetical protein
VFHINSGFVLSYAELDDLLSFIETVYYYSNKEERDKLYDYCMNHDFSSPYSLVKDLRGMLEGFSESPK